MKICKRCGKELHTTLPKRLCPECKKEAIKQRRKKYYNKEYYREYMRNLRGYREPNECKYCGSIVYPSKNSRHVCDKCREFKYRLRVYKNEVRLYYDNGNRLY